MATDTPHLDRARAEGFGGLAADYDRHRPRYPAELFDELLASRPNRVLDVGCGTGRVAAPIVERGIDVLGVEPDSRMASVARSCGVPVEIGTFEQWNDAGRRFDLITCGAAWHWVDPEQGAVKAAKVLHSGGTLARFLNYRLLDDQSLARLDAVYSAHAPEILSDGRPPPDRWNTEDPVTTSSSFSGIRSYILRSNRTVNTDEWLGTVSTLSDHIALGSGRLSRLLTALRAVIEADFSGTLHAISCTRVVVARRV